MNKDMIPEGKKSGTANSIRHWDYKVKGYIKLLKESKESRDNEWILSPLGVINYVLTEKDNE
jgi:hypothetical protein